MRLTIRDTEHSLVRALEALGVRLDLRCGGTGRCGRCRVKLLSGRWSADDLPVAVPAELSACRCRLTGGIGEVEVPESSLAPNAGEVETRWRTRPLPRIPGDVVAVDLGTTTVAAIRLREGIPVGTAGMFNPQNRYGDNVVSRIAAARHELPGLQRAATEAINTLLARLDGASCDRIAVAGNTVETLLLHGIDPTSIGEFPFHPSRRKFARIPARGIGIDSDAELLTCPCISGYLGGDLCAGMAETGLKPGEMLIDLGTNCEIVFRTPEGVFGTSAAAGPAFEGAGISAGLRAVSGAIDHYTGPGAFSVIGGSAPRGICGSALIDLLAVERASGRLDRFGRIVPSAPSLAVAPGINISESEIEQLLKAKAAVFAGIRSLEKACASQADRIVLAGGFANALSISHAVAIGMLPDREYRIVGNTSLAGALRLGLEPDRLPEYEALSDIPKEIPLNELPDFEQSFIDAMLLP